MIQEQGRTSRELNRLFSRREALSWMAVKGAGLAVAGTLTAKVTAGLFEDIPGAVAQEANIVALEAEANSRVGMPSQDEILTSRRVLGLPTPDSFGIFLSQFFDSVGISVENDIYSYDQRRCNPSSGIDHLKDEACSLLKVASERKAEYKRVSGELNLPEQRLAYWKYSLRRVIPLALGISAWVAAFNISTDPKVSDRS